MKAYEYTINGNNPPKMVNSTGADATFGGAQCNRVVVEKEDYNSTALAGK